MSDSAFIDTNVLVYLFDEGAPKKRDRARKRLASERAARDLIVSTQVLQELYVALTRGAKPIAMPDVAERAVREVAALTTVQIDAALVLEAVVASRQHALSFWDALIVRAAAQAGCDILLTEDMQHGQTIDGVRIENPFRA